MRSSPLATLASWISASAISRRARPARATSAASRQSRLRESAIRGARLPATGRSLGSRTAMPESKYDCIVIGSGPGGYVGAIRAAQLGLKTAVVEKGNTGGRCLNEACIPAKSILRVAEVMSEVQHAGDFGISVGDTSVDYSGAASHRDKVVKTLTGGVAGLFKKNKIDLIEGFGSVTDDGNVKIGGQFDGTEIETDRVILACG